MRRLVSRVVAAGIATTVAGVLGAGALGVSTALPTTGVDLREGAAGRVHVPVPAPGASTSFHVTAHPGGAGPAALTLVLDEATGPGDRDVELTLSDDTGAVLAAGSAARLRGARVDLGVVDDGPVTVHGTASLPDSAPAADCGGTLALDVRVAGDPDPGRRPPASDGMRTASAVGPAPVRPHATA
ncbi:hypothetical protein [Cellulomonas pakistanensis]|uniref:Uncharacterized protein n=1 Tax=Cellulomonas pakistanensis TaxID=992287 RepID=A0A919PB43_9CELL|nr:hypothetical protein [Cellulomonas pakistanensis]GIG36928.1 hypothetical protein Cpa01nite_23090 [Cellulomonas pakistanensis]